MIKNRKEFKEYVIKIEEKFEALIRRNNNISDENSALRDRLLSIVNTVITLE